MRLGRAIEPAAAERFEVEARLAQRKWPPDIETAKRALKAAWAASPYDALYPEMLAELACQQRDWDAAFQFARNALGLEPNFVEPYLVYAEAFAHQGRREEGRRMLQLFDRAAKLPRGSSGYERMLAFSDWKRRERIAELLR